MDWTKVLAGLDQAAKLVEALAPLAALAGPTGQAAAALIGAGAKFADAALTEAQGAAGVLSSNDLATIEAASAQLAAANAKIAGQIDAS